MTKEIAAWLALFVAGFLAAICYLISYPARAEGRPDQPACAPFEEVVGYLGEEHKEKLRWFGDISGGTRLIILDSKDGTWTAVQTDGRRACVIFAGDGSTFQLGEPA